MITYCDGIRRRGDLEYYATKALAQDFLPKFLFAGTPICRCYSSLTPLMNDSPGVFNICTDIERLELQADFYFIFSEDITERWEEQDYVGYMVYHFLRLDIKFVGVTQKPIMVKARNRIEYDDALNKYFDNPIFFSYSQRLDETLEGRKYDADKPRDTKSIMELMNDM